MDRGRSPALSARSDLLAALGLGLLACMVVAPPVLEGMTRVTHDIIATIPLAAGLEWTVLIIGARRLALVVQKPGGVAFGAGAVVAAAHLAWITFVVWSAEPGMDLAGKVILASIFGVPLAALPLAGGGVAALIATRRRVRMGAAASAGEHPLGTHLESNLWTLLTTIALAAACFGASFFLPKAAWLGSVAFLLGTAALLVLLVEPTTLFRRSRRP